MKGTYIISIVLAGAGLFSCKQEQKEITPTIAQVDKKIEVIQNSPKFELLWETDSIFKTTESCLYDPKRDVIYVSNVNNAPRTKDDNGFISTISKDGKLINLNWATGMSAPKGMGLFGDKLYATDIDAIVEIDTNTGKILNRYPLEGALMLNDITVDNKGVVYFTAMDTNKIYTLQDGTISLWKEGLNKPNGLLVENDKLMVASLGEGTLKSYDLKTKESVQLADGLGKGDGVVKLTTGNYVVSDWRGEIFHINKGKATSVYNTIEQNLQTADIGIIPNEDVILIPTFFGNGVKAYKLTE